MAEKKTKPADETAVDAAGEPAAEETPVERAPVAEAETEVIAEAPTPEADKAAPEADEPEPPAAAVEEAAAPEAEAPEAEAPVATAAPAAEQVADEPAAEAAAPAEAPAASPAPTPQSGPKPKKKRLPRALRSQKTRPVREKAATRKPIVRLEQPEHERGRSQERQGTVVSAAMEKTIVVKVDLIKAHPRYKKVVRRSNTFHAHDERNEAKVGDVVRIVETRPLSKTKRWRLAEIVEAAK